MKRRILLTGEASFLSTGFSVYAREILRRLYATGKYEIAEMGSWAPSNHPEARKLPWRFYGVLPQNEAERQAFEAGISPAQQQSNPNHFGKYKIDAVLADFQPDIVFDFRDPWMFEHIVHAKFRPNYKFVVMPTVDSAPQRPEWLQGSFANADVLLTYSRYGKSVLEKEGLKVLDVASPGVDLNVFKPLPREEVRDKFHLKPSLFVFGTLMRNQKRKLLPDLFDAYKKLRDKWTTRQNIARIKDKANAEKQLTLDEKKALRVEHSVLYCHTSWPDNGWNIPEYLKRYQLQRHVIFTYKCDACKAVFCSWFMPSDPKGFATCRVCGEHKAHMPNTHSGVDEKDLVDVLNLFDAYVHPAICEGWGLPIMEAKACGVPGLYQNYSAMEDHVENGGGLPIKVERFYHEAETTAIRSLPSITDMVEKMELLAFDDKKRAKLAKDARDCAVRMHSWDTTAKKIEKLFDSMELHDRSQTWDKPAEFKQSISLVVPPNLSNEEFVLWLYRNILKREPDEKGFNDWMTTLSNGGKRKDVEGFFRGEIEGANQYEEMRWRGSLNIRGINEIVEDQMELSDTLPGMLV